MDSETAMIADRMRDRANHLRQLARQDSSREVAAGLERLARHFETDAAKLQSGGGGASPG